MKQISEHAPESKSKIVTIPNILSLFRICLIPLIVWLYLTFTLIWCKLPTKLENKAFVGSPLCYALLLSSISLKNRLKSSCFAYA